MPPNDQPTMLSEVRTSSIEQTGFTISTIEIPFNKNQLSRFKYNSVSLTFLVIIPYTAGRDSPTKLRNYGF